MMHSSTLLIVTIVCFLGFLTTCLSNPVLTPEGWNESDSEYFDYRRWKILDPNWPTQRNKREIVGVNLTESEMDVGTEIDELMKHTRSTGDPLVVVTTQNSMVQEDDPTETLLNVPTMLVIEEGSPVTE